MTRYASIIGTGSYLPENTLTNEDLERMVDTSDEWIVTRTGIKERRLAETHHGTSDLAFEAGARALACAGVAAEDVDLLVVGTSTPDHLFPSTRLHHPGQARSDVSGIRRERCLLGVHLRPAGGNVCRRVGALRHGAGDRCGCADPPRRLHGSRDVRALRRRRRCGGPRASDEQGVWRSSSARMATGAELLKVPAGGSAAAVHDRAHRGREHYVHMNGNDVFKFAVRMIPKATHQGARGLGSSLTTSPGLIPHQANQRILDRRRAARSRRLSRLLEHRDLGTHPRHPYRSLSTTCILTANSSPGTWWRWWDSVPD